MRFALSPLESELAAMNRTEEDLKRLKDSLEVLREETDAKKEFFWIEHFIELFLL